MEPLMPLPIRQIFDNLTFPAFKIVKTALTSVAQLVGHHPAQRKVISLIPGPGTSLCCGFGPQLGRVGKATN